MSRSIEQEIQELRAMTVADLVDRYEELSGKMPRCRQHAHLWRRCAWKLLERRYGGLSGKAKERLDELVTEIKLPVVDRSFPRTTGDLTPGTVLTRVWRGREIRVVVRRDGTVEHDGETYSSLSAAARGITGSRWNGRLFFGLTSRKKTS